MYKLGLCQMQVEAHSWNAGVRNSPVPCRYFGLTCSHGPRQVKGRQYAGKAELNVTFNMAPFADVQRFKPGRDVESPSAAALVQQALLPAIRLDLLPKASVDVYVTVLDMDTSMSGCIALAVTAASAALAEAGIEMFGLVTGATAVCVSD